jgi:hypothetical protein
VRKTKDFDLFVRARAAGLHVLISAVVVVVAALLVFGLWYPGQYRLWAGGRELFYLVASVDFILGPLLTFAVFKPQKGWPVLRRDLAVIGLIQLAALMYGVYTVFLARPVAMVFEKDRFRVISAAQVHLTELEKAPTAYRRLPLGGPWLLGSRDPDEADSKDALFLSLGGVDRAQRPLLWQPYSVSVSAALARARPVSALVQRYPHMAVKLRAELNSLKIDQEQASFLPLVARGGDWVAILDPAGQPVHFVAADGFF